MTNSSMWTMKYLSRYALISFFLMSAIYLLIGSVDLNYYNISLVTYSKLIYQFLVFLSIFTLLMIFHKKLLIIDIHILFTLTVFIYLFIFMIKSPAFSLLIGGLLISLPFIFFTIITLIKNQLNLINRILLFINIGLFLAIIVFFITRIGYIFPEYLGDNMSLISHQDIIPTDKTKFIYYSLVFSLVFFTFLTFLDHNKESKLLSKTYLLLGLILVVLEVIALSTIMVYRTKILGTSTYDFGIFTQMFYNMKNFNGMYTTLERSVLLSHNAVHVSPIYYLMLPIFMIFPFPETLQILQVVIVATGVIPIYLIGKHYHLNSKIILIIVASYIFHPAIISSSFYDLHENCFLGPLLLFVIYFGLKQKWIYLFIAFVLTLMIKEDSGLYLVFIGLFFLFSHSNNLENKNKRNNMIMSVLMIILSISYFLIITKLINTQGDGAMFWRYDNLNAYPDLGIIGIPLSLFQAPTYWLATMFSPNKIYHLLVIFVVLGFIPLLTTKLSRYWLIIPLLVLNFSSTYPYQHQFGFQYYYGTITLLTFMMILVFSDFKKESISNPIKITSIFTHVIVIVGLSIIGFQTISSKNYYIEYYDMSSEMYDSMKETLINIPKDKKILATGYLTTYLGDREVLYDYNYYNFRTQDVEFDLVLIDNRTNEERRNQIKITLALNGYVESDLSTDYITIYEPT